MESKTKHTDGPPFAPLTGSALWERAKHNDATVAKGLKAGEGLETIIGYLAAEKEWMMKRLIALESIAPRKITLPDGRVMVWHCPDDLIPEAPNVRTQPPR